ncbi:MAG: hypothetical protein CEE43_01675 [Promethearchaeota archaeon Loki_b32]|nr:MAG: hypothetical protein CEE43_01675 [Candidatus Lokiarchaeota archaeon Loki_b32]
MADCFDKILEICENSEIKRYKALIKLMQDLDKEISNAIRVRNCLILLVNLCFNPDSPDYAYNKGKSSESLSAEERVEMLELLKCEFNN